MSREEGHPDYERENKHCDGHYYYTRIPVDALLLKILVCKVGIFLNIYGFPLGVIKATPVLYDNIISETKVVVFFSSDTYPKFYFIAFSLFS